MAITPKEYRAQMMKERGKTESTGINPKSPRARLEKQKASSTSKSSITPKERRAQMIKDRKENFFTRKAKKPAISERAKKIQQAKADVEKGLPRGKPAPSQMEDYKPTGTAAGKAAGKAAAAGVGTAAGKAAGKASPKAKAVTAGISEFGKAFAAARKAGKPEFKFNDKMYAAVTKQEVSRAGSSNLGDYLNKLKRSERKMAKAPGQSDTFKKGGMSKKFSKKGKIKKYQEGGAVSGAGISPEAMREMSGAAMSRKELEELRRKMLPKDFERDFDRPRGNIRTLPLRPGMDLEPKRMPGKPGMKPKGQYLKEKSGAAVSENEMKSLMEQMAKPESRDRFAKGGSVMARGCKLGRKKTTKLY